MGVNDVFLQNIQRNLSAANASAFAQEQASNKLAGAAAVARGASLDEVKKNAPFLEKVFGKGATIQGANTQYVEQGVNKYINDSAANMKELRKQDPETFARTQIQQFSGMMTGDADVDDMMTLMAQKAIEPVVKMQQKQHLAWVQEEELNGFNARVSSAYSAYDAVVKAGGDEDDVQAAINNIADALKKNDRMDTDAHEAAVVAWAEARAEYGDATLADQDILQSLGVVISPENATKVAQAQAKAQDKFNQQHAIDKAMDLTAIDQYSRQPNATFDTIVEMARQGATKYGEDWTGDRMIGWAAHMLQGKSKEDEKVLNLTKYINGIAMTDGDGKKAQTAYRELQYAKVANGTLTTEEAEENILNAWANEAYKDEVMSNQLSAALAFPLLAGEINPTFVQNLGVFNKYYAKNPTKAADMISDTVSLQRVLNINKATGYGASLDEAVQLYAEPRVVKDIEAFQQSREFRETVAKVVATAQEGNTDLPFISDDHWAAAQNTPWFWSRAEDAVKEVILKSGITEGADEAAFALLRQRSEIVDGQWIDNNGKPLSSRYGKGTGNDVIKHFKETKWDTFFPNYSKDVFIQYNHQMDTMTFFTKDELGLADAPVGSNFGKPFKMQDLYSTYNEEVVLPKEAQNLLDNSTTARNGFETYKAAFRDMPEYRDLTDEEYEARIRIEYTKQSEQLHKFLQQPAEKVIQALKFANRGGQQIMDFWQAGSKDIIDFLKTGSNQIIGK